MYYLLIISIIAFLVLIVLDLIFLILAKRKIEVEITIFTKYYELFNTFLHTLIFFLKKYFKLNWIFYDLTKSHLFRTLSLESNIFSFKNLTRFWTWKNLLTGILSIFIITLYKYFEVTNSILNLFNIPSNEVIENIIFLTITLSTWLGIKKFIEPLVNSYMEWILPVYSMMTNKVIDDSNNIYTEANSDSGSGKRLVKNTQSMESSKIESSTPNKDTEDVWTPEYKNQFYNYLQQHMAEYEKINQKNEEMFKLATSVDLHVDNPEAVLHIIRLLQSHTTMLNKSFDNRLAWLSIFKSGCPSDIQEKLNQIESNKHNSYEKYLKSIEGVRDDIDMKTFAKLTFNSLNAFRNEANKEVNKGEEILNTYIRKTPIYKEDRFKQLITHDYLRTKKIFSDQDSYLRKKVSEVLNAPKK